VAAGHSNKEIAARLALSPNTVKMYNSVIYEKLGVRRRTEAVARARALGLL
jgi:ATP/maltotriose-dependent transcriptional regulator MalT